MKKFTMMLMATLMVVFAQAASPAKRFIEAQLPTKAATPVALNAKKAPAGMTAKVQKARGMKKAASTATELAGWYLWDYEMTSDYEDETAARTAGQATIEITATDATNVTISRMFANDITGTLDAANGYITIPCEQVIGTSSSYGDYVLYGLFYYEGDEENEAGWYYDDVHFVLQDDGSMIAAEWFVRVLTSGQYAGYSLTPYWADGSTLTPTEAPELPDVVEAPADLQAEEYILQARDYDDAADVNMTVNVGFDGSDVYIQGLCSYIPKAWVKGTLDGTTVTFASGQYFGNFSGYDMLLNTDEDVVFDYDAETNTFTAQNEVFLTDDRTYYFDAYRNCVIYKEPELPEGQKQAQWVAAEQGYANAQDITEFKIGDYITVTLAQNEGSTHPKYYTSGSAVRIYDLNSFTFTASAEVESIDKIVLNFASSSYNGYLSTDVETYTADGATGTWEGTANDVTFINDKSSADAASNKQARIVSIDVYYTMVAEPKPEGLYDFAEGTLDPWTTIDADGDGYDWTLAPGTQINARGGDDDYAVYSQSYVNNVGPVTPDNYLVSPKVKLDGSITFYGCAQDASYFAEHFGVYVSTKGNTDPADFEKVQEWDMAASRAAKVSRGAFRAPAKVAGQWHEYTVDLSGYEGAEGYVAIRHFDCTDFFFLVVDDITLKTSQVILPDMKVTPKEGVVESIETVTVDFNNYMIELVDADNAKAELYKDDNWDEPVATAPIYEIGGKQLYISFPEAITEAGEYALLIPKGTFMNSVTMEQNDDEAFFYTIEAEPEVVVLPEGAELQTWYLTANAYSGKVKGDEVSVAFVGSDLYVQGLNSYLPEAWVMGTSNGDGTYTFANGQYYGKYDNDGELLDMFFCGTSDAKTVSDVTFTYQEEAGILSTEDYVILNSNTETLKEMYDYYEPGLQITSFKPEFPEPLVAPEDLATETYLFKGFDTYNEEEESGREVQVGFYGDNEVWFQGLSYFLPEAWVKGTIDSDGNVTIPETYLGIYQYLDWNTFTVVEIETTFGTATFKYDAEAQKFTSEEGFTSFDEDGYTMDEYTDVELTKVIEKEATPADPSVDIFSLYYTPGEADTELQFRTFPYASFDIPTVDINGEPMVTDKLGYIVYIVDKDGVEQKLTITNDLYTEMPEGTTEMTEIPYKYDDSYDIYAGGETFYLNWNAEEIATWQKIGVQSVYHGLGFEHTSNIGWFDIQQYIADLQAMLPTGISQISTDAEGARFFDLQGRRADKSQKGLLIMQTSNGKTVKVIRK